ncbi:6-phosphofructokinase [Carboxydothermus islandicus]|uniref:ATP-dependent 6-phosphofructokinase n=1 Tax=Carboxydothermus islandicus TaxID=661089 RepID=A0A1L8D2W7_9THEO|nr:6-phosphofructokinase [Carboxydothermus islandicus]GAV25518.1 6-phosphofructokinase [Carboxydothermus islandicus]
MAVGILTGGGDCPGLNAVIRALVKTLQQKLPEEKIIGFLDGFRGAIENRRVPLTTKDVVGLLPKGGTILGTSNRDNPFKFPISVNGTLEFHDVSDTVIENLHKNNIEVLFVIGGDGSLSIAHELSQKGVKVIGIPKTIDNDLDATDFTFGFDSAVRTATKALDMLHTTAESHHRIMVLEVMGRYAGWIALYSGLAGGADVILIPEIPFNWDAVCRKIQQRKAEGKHFSIVVVAEGAYPEGGERVIARYVKESTDPARLGGIGQVVADHLSRCTGLESRVTVLGHLQRGGGPTPFDRILATRFGVAAVNTWLQGNYNVMVALLGGRVTTVPLSEGIKKLKLVPVDSELIVTAKAIGISFGDE